MNLKTAIAIAVAAAFAVPLAAQASADADKIIVAQTSGSTMQPKDSNPAAPPASTAPHTSGSAPVTSGSNAPDRTPNTPKAEAGATAKGGFAAIDKNNDGYISRDEAKDATWENRFTELDKDNDNRLSKTEFEALQAGTGAAGATGTTNAPVTSGSNAPDRKPNTPKTESGAKPKQ